MQSDKDNFSEWFDGQFLCSRDAASPLLISDNKTIRGKFLRIKKVCLMLLENPNEDIQGLREKIAMLFFITMRCSLDYINYAKTVLEEYKKSLNNEV